MDNNLDTSADGSGAYPLRELAALLQAVARGAEGERGSRAWAGLVTLTSRPVISAFSASGMEELASLRQEPDDGYLADKLAHILLVRARTDGSFHAAMTSWRGQSQIQMLEKAIHEVGSDGSTRSRGDGKRNLIRPGRRKAVGWAAGVATVGIAAFVTAYFTVLGTNAAVISTRPGPPGGLPVKINSVQVFQSVHSPGWALPGVVRLSKAQLAQRNQLTRSEGYAAAFAPLISSNGGVLVGTSQVDIAVTGNAAQPVRITGINVVDKTCRAPLTGTLFYTGDGQGEGPTIAVDFNLDALDPVALAPSGQEFFAVHTITLKLGEQQTLIIQSDTERYYCHFELQLAVLVGSRTTRETITNHGNPFEAAAGPSFRGGVPYSRYGAVYAGGDVNTSPTDDGAFVPENPATYNGQPIGLYAHG